MNVVGHCPACGRVLFAWEFVCPCGYEGSYGEARQAAEDERQRQDEFCRQVRSTERRL